MAKGLFDGGFQRVGHSLNGIGRRQLKLQGWRDTAASKQEILDSVARYKACQPPPNF